MNLKEAQEAMETHAAQSCYCFSDATSPYCYKAEGFIEGWNARMEFEQELNGKPREEE